MEIRISVADGDAADVESLADWLRGERELTGRVNHASPELRSGQLGGLSDALVVAVGSGGTISVLAAALKGLSDPADGIVPEANCEVIGVPPEEGAGGAPVAPRFAPAAMTGDDREIWAMS